MFDVLTSIQGITEIVSGVAPGADRVAESYAKDKQIYINIIPADWDNGPNKVEGQELKKLTPRSH